MRTQDPWAIHFCLYETNSLINQIFFEILYLGMIAHNSEELFLIPPNVLIFVEVANTIQERLLYRINHVLDKVQ